MRVFMLLTRASFALAQLAWGQVVQFSGLSTTGDGSSVYFVTTLPQRDSNQGYLSKIFRIDSGGAHYVAQAPAGSAAFPSASLGSPQVSADGTLLAYVLSEYCDGGSSCIPQHVFTQVVPPSGNIQAFFGAGSLSRSGQFLASYGITAIGAPWYFQLTDLSSGAVVYQSRTENPSGVAVADNGTSILENAQSIALIQNGQQNTLASSVAGNTLEFTEAAIDAGATTAVWGLRQSAGQSRILMVYNFAAGTQLQISPANADSYGASLSADGKWVLYISQAGGQPQALFEPSGGPARTAVQLTNDPSGVVASTLSGNGQYAFVTTGDGKLLRIATASGAIETWIGPTPTIQSAQGSVPGSLFILTGSGLANASATIAGFTPPILGRSNTSLVFQVPWEAPLSATTLTIPEGGAPYFAVSVPLTLQSFAPSAIPLGLADPVSDYTPIAVHSDWGSLVTQQNPAAVGEVVHMFLTGGGPVDGAVVTGVAAPLSPLERITTPVFVTIDQVHGLNVPFLGLAPGELGVYQMDFQISQPPANGNFNVTIDYDVPYANSSLLGTIPVK